MKIAVIQGGPSSEAHVSRASAAAVAQALQSCGHQVGSFELGAELARELAGFSPEVVFPVVHGAQGEDGCLQGMLEILNYRYVGSGVRASAIAADKITTKVFLERVGLPLARDRVLDSSRRSESPGELLATLRAELGAAMILKPAQGGSTIGMSRVLASTNPDEFRAALDLAFSYDSKVLVEQYVEGAEVTCAVLEGEDGPRALPVTLITSQATEWYDFQSKYAAGGSRHQCPAPFPQQLTVRIQEAAVAAHRAVGARDLSRTDFLVRSSGEMVVLEVNTSPGMTEVSLFPEAAGVSGLPFAELVDFLANRALSRKPGLVQVAPPWPSS